MMGILDPLYKFNTNVILKIKAKYLVRYKMDVSLQRVYRNEIGYLRHRIDAIPYDLDVEVPNVKKDVEAGLYYAVVAGKKMYFPENYKKERIKRYVKGLLREQADGSPHKYVDEEFDVDEGDIVLDLGAAEANFAFMVAPKAKELILVEPDRRYNKAFEYTFKDYSDKTRVVNSFVSDIDGGANRTVDALLGGYEGEKIFIKMDLEGYGLNALMGAVKTLKNNDCKISCACYHTKEEAYHIQSFFEENLSEYKISFSKGYMFFWCSHGFKYPYFRKGIIRAKK